MWESWRYVVCKCFVGVSDSKEQLQKLIDVVYSYCSKWRLKANVTKSPALLKKLLIVLGSGESIIYLLCLNTHIWG